MRAARASFDRFRHDRVQRRIGQELIGELARRIGIGTGELDRRRRAHALVVADVTGDDWRRVVIHADRRIEARERVRAIQARIFAREVGDRYVGVVVPAAEGQRPLLGQRDRIGDVDADIIVAKVDVGFRREIAGCDGSAVCVEIRRLRLLREVRASEIATRANGDLMRHSGELAVRGELRAEAVARLVDGRKIVGRFVCLRQAGVLIDLPVIVVHVAADIGRSVQAIVRVAAEQQRIIQESAAFGGDEREPVLIDVGVRIRLLRISEHR